MAIVKSITLDDGNAGEYWKIIEVNSHAVRNSSACVLQLYKSKTLREADAQPMNKSLQFVFSGDEVEAMDADENLPAGWRDVYFHVHYLAIKSAVASGSGKLPEDKTQNEKTAEVLYGYADEI